MTTPPVKPVRLADFRKKLDPVELPSGKVVDVYCLNGEGYQLYQQWLAEPDNVDLAWDIAALCIPDASAEDVIKLDVNQCAAVISLAAGQAEAVRAWGDAILGKSAGPTETTPAPAPDSSSAIPSDTSAQPSPADTLASSPT